jgi:hypothetical protein
VSVGARTRWGYEERAQAALALLAVLVTIVLATCAHASAATIAGNASGDQAVAFQFPEEYAHLPFFVALRPADGIFGRSIPLTPKRTSQVALAVGPDGAAVAAWDSTSGVHASFREPGGAWGKAAKLADDGDFVHVAVDARGGALVVWRGDGGAVGNAFRPPGGRFGRGPDLVDAGRVQSLETDAAGNALVLSVLDRTNDSVLKTAYRPAGGEFAAPESIRTVPHYSSARLAMNAAGDAIAVFLVKASLYAARKPAGGDLGAPVRVSRSGSETPDFDVCGIVSPDDVSLGGDGTAAVTWTSGISPDADTCSYTDRHAFVALAPGGGAFEPPLKLGTPDHPGDVARLAADDRGDTAVAWGQSGFGPYALLRPPGGAFGSPLRIARPGLGGPPDVAIDGNGGATLAWLQNDGEHVEFVTRDLTAAGAAPSTQVLRRAPAFTPLPHPRARCNPAGTRTLLRNRDVRVYRNLRDPNRPKYACLMRAGRPYALDFGFGDFPLTTAPPPAMALAGPLLAYTYFDEECGTCGGHRGLSVIDMRTRDTANGFGPVGDPDPLIDDYGPIRRIVLRRDTALAYILCEGTRRNDCRRRGVTSRVYKMDPGAPRPVLLAKGKTIDARFLRLAGSRVRWRQDGRIRTAPLG